MSERSDAAANAELAFATEFRPILTIPTFELTWFIKRVLDLILALLGIIVLAPLFVLISLAIRLESPGRVLFRQRRYGLNCTTFEMIKFRTMRSDLSDLTAGTQTTHNDSRVTRVGAIIRRHSLDEIPQLFNVLRGEMSLVGPRPHALGTSVNGILVRAFVPNYDFRYLVKPGLTGLAQVSGLRGELNTREKALLRIERDLDYIENWTLGLDFKIVVKTILCIFRDGHAY